MSQPHYPPAPAALAKSATVLPQLLALVGRMSVREFARLAGMPVESLARMVVGSSSVLDDSSEGHTKIDAPGREPDPPIESALSDLVGRATLREVRDVLDRWLLGRVLEEHGGNVTRTAARLGISRRRVRERRAAVVDGDRPSPAPREKDTNPPVVPFPLPSLTALVEGSGTYSDVHETVGRWLAACVLEQEGGNVSSAARILGVGRRLLRELRDGSS